MQVQLLSLILLAGLVLFMRGRPRYDLVALGMLLLATLLGLVPLDRCFLGFSHPAVITVAAVFIISRGVENTGVLGEAVYRLRLTRKVVWKQVGLICLIVALLSGFINNVGAVALLLPTTLRIARINNIPRQLLLMPLAFSSLLGGLITLIGTPPNIIISGYRADWRGEPFAFFDFTFVGLGTALLGIAFIAFIGWRLIPFARRDETSEFHHEKYTVELQITRRSSLAGKKLSRFLSKVEGKVEVLALARNSELVHDNLEHYTAAIGDTLILNTDRWNLSELIKRFHLSTVSGQNPEQEGTHYLVDLVVLPDSPLCKQALGELELVSQQGLSPVAVSRRDEVISTSVGQVTLKPGDVVMMRSETPVEDYNIDALRCVRVEESYERPYSPAMTARVLSIFAACLLPAVVGWLPVSVAFVTCALLLLLVGPLTLENAYRRIDWPVLILVGALIPVGEAVESSGLAAVISYAAYGWAEGLPMAVTIFALIWSSMLLSNIINNAAVAVIFAPIALQTAFDWGIVPDPLLMAVAIGASCTFLTPIGHQSNALVLGPGGYRFSDYWLMGLPLTFLVSLVATWLISLWWPIIPLAETLR